jgi:hypothetical protein
MGRLSFVWVGIWIGFGCNTEFGIGAEIGSFGFRNTTLIYNEKNLHIIFETLVNPYFGLCFYIFPYV